MRACCKLILHTVIIALSQSSTFAQGLVGGPVEPPGGPPPPSAEEISRINQITGMVLSSTPENKKRQFKGPSTVSVVKCHFDNSGLLSALRLDQASIWLDQDFYTLWAVASFPPVKPYSSPTLEPTMIICNSPGQARDTTAAEASTGKTIADFVAQAQGRGDKIFFTLIPGSFTEVFSGSIHLSDICNKENLVSVSMHSLKHASKCGWTKAANSKSASKIADLLDEWPHFFSKSSHPSRSSIIEFAASIRKKYKPLFTDAKTS